MLNKDLAKKKKVPQWLKMLIKWIVNVYVHAHCFLASKSLSSLNYSNGTTDHPCYHNKRSGSA